MSSSNHRHHNSDFISEHPEDGEFEVRRDRDASTSMHTITHKPTSSVSSSHSASKTEPSGKHQPNQRSAGAVENAQVNEFSLSTSHCGIVRSLVVVSPATTIATTAQMRALERDGGLNFVGITMF